MQAKSQRPGWLTFICYSYMSPYMVVIYMAIANYHTHNLAIITGKSLSMLYVSHVWCLYMN